MDRNHNRLLETFLRDPGTEFHVRNLALRLGISPTTASKYLRSLERQGLLVREKRLQAQVFRANAQNPLYRHRKLCFHIEQLWSSGLIDYLIDRFNNPEAIVLFGSCRKGESTPQSDVDLLIITPAKRTADVSAFEKKIGQEIQLFVHSRQEIDRLKDQNMELLNNFVNGVVLHGFWEVFL
ncbi:nucleotidyltransferase domain-containing protein [Candidatus Woesearchaeota archaeon]|nr:nucleotidyltransferase domain-containing protein [Candidatus Woesearchaeota archaeon]